MEVLGMNCKGPNSRSLFRSNYFSPGPGLIIVVLGFLLLSACQDPSVGAPQLSTQAQETLFRPTQLPTPSPLSPTAFPTKEAAITPTSTDPQPIPAGVPDADVLFVRATFDSASGAWTFEVTISHPDTGWEDYADGWDVVGSDGTVYKPDPGSPFTRLLLHPHVGEQPFTRNQRGIKIPLAEIQVLVRAHDLRDGFGGKEVLVDLTLESGPDFEVIR